MRNKKKKKYSQIISSSETSQYVFCPLSWWYDRNGEKIVTKSMKQGTDFHIRQSKKQTISQILYVIQKIAITTLVLLFFALIWRLIQ